MQTVTPVRYDACHDNDTIVAPTKWEIDGACQVGRWMWEKSQADGRQDHYGHVEDGGGLRIQMLGAVAERAAAKALGMYWPGAVDQGREADIPPNIEVRLIGVDRYGLRVRPSDPDDFAVVGVVIEKGKEREPYRIPGWIRAEDAKRDEWLMGDGRGTGKLATGRPVYLVPQSELRPLCPLEMVGNPDYWRF